MTRLSIEELISVPAIIPVITITDEKKAIELAKALKTGGLKTLEITLRTDKAINAAAAIIHEDPDLIIGIGTVTTPDEIKKAKDSGAKFIVSPGLTEKLATVAADEAIPFLPGCCTPSDVIFAKQLEFSHVKFFPAELSGGIKMLQQFSALFSNMKFCPTGGINEKTAVNYLKLRNVFCLGGSWLTPLALINNNDWEAVRKIAEQACCIVKALEQH